MKALIDGDIVAFRCAATAEDEENPAIAIWRTEKCLEEIMEATGAKSCEIFLTGEGNFRKELAPYYKAHRVKPKPKHLPACEQHLQEVWGAVVCQGYEADDALGFSQTGEETIIVSIDKDLLQVPGWHYNFVKGDRFYVNPMRAIREFYTQLLVGDTADNIKGAAGIGKVKAERLLEGCETEEEMFDTVRGAYNDDALFEETGKLLWIWKKKGDIWNSTLLSKLEADRPQGSTPKTEVESTPSMEPTGTQKPNDGPQ